MKPIAQQTRQSNNRVVTRERGARYRPLLPHNNYAERAPVERLVTHLWRCGPRAIAEFLDALAIENGIGTSIATKLQEYRRLTPEMLAAVGADKFAPNPTREIVP